MVSHMRIRTQPTHMVWLVMCWKNGGNGRGDLPGACSTPGAEEPDGPVQLLRDVDGLACEQHEVCHAGVA